MRFVVIGCGSIGRRHAKNLQHLGHEVVGADVLAANRQWMQENLRIKCADSAKSALASAPDAALICTPTSTHVKLAMDALAAGCDVFIEKPISNSLSGIAALQKEAKKRKAIVLCACNLRFSTALMRIRELVDSGAIGKILYARMQYGNYLPSLRPGDYRKTYAAKKGEGGIVLDDVHEIDYARWLMGEPEEVSCMAGNVSSLGLQSEDTADLLLRFRSGAIASLHTDYFQRAYQRTCELIGEFGTIAWQDHKGELSYYLDREKEKGWQAEKLPVAGYENDMYVKEMRHFAACVERKESPMCGIAEAAVVLKIALAANKASAQGKAVKIK